MFFFVNLHLWFDVKASWLNTKFSENASADVDEYCLKVINSFRVYRYIYPLRKGNQKQKIMPPTYVINAHNTLEGEAWLPT